MRKLWNIFIEKVLCPRFCIFCKKENNYICTRCETSLSLKNNSFEKNNFYSKYNYKDARVKKLLFKIKYFHNKYLARELGNIYADFIMDILQKNNIKIEDMVLIPVPISKNRLRERGYNQVEEICLGIKEKSKFIEISKAIIKIKDTEKLNKKKNKEDRINELNNAFAVNQEEFVKLKDKKIIVIDDITTSGATFYNIKNILKNKNIAEKNIFCFALAN